MLNFNNISILHTLIILIYFYTFSTQTKRMEEDKKEIMARMYASTAEKLPPGYKLITRATPKGPMAWVIKSMDQEAYSAPPAPDEHPIQMFDRVYEAIWNHIETTVHDLWREMKLASFKGETICFRVKYEHVYLVSISNISNSCNAHLAIRINGLDFDSLSGSELSTTPMVVATKPGYVLLDDKYDAMFPCICMMIETFTGCKPTYFYNKDDQVLELKAWTMESFDKPVIGLSITFTGRKPDPDCIRNNNDDTETIVPE
jgi:hypothetical protein